MHIQSYLSQCGAFSRRETARLLKAGRVTINGETGHERSTVAESDLVLVDGTPLPSPAEPVYLAFHKPRGITCTAQSSVEGNLSDYLNWPTRIFPVGRLDKDSDGLLLLTNDGTIVNQLMKEEQQKQKEYLVTVKRPITDDMLERMRAGGILIKGRAASAATVEKLDDFSFRIVLMQGLNRQIRRMCRACGNEVLTLTRVRIEHIELGSLPSGEWRALTESEITLLT
ncbi:pseudouridine synthase [Jeotgalibacillus aurantiacus]|uniref:pseudouridine synthase n=1 Tax=Jeotgalibacillus aurantiacus TaxID=2763266 RepID=UPI001D0ABB1B|nr:pseudouridine synthase [Jeotgalibacillus aurantiacus]